MIKETGSVSVTTENIFPIIRKWLYSDRDIFLRELVSNASDAISKLKRLTELGEAEVPEGSDNYRIDVRFDSEAGTLSIEDNGIGMTADEIRRYINQIAYSGVMDFVEKYQSKGAEKDGIIGHFGLGFYSAFMVADEVRIDTLSWQPEAEAASWVSEDGINYTMAGSERDSRGSLISLKLSEEGREFLSAAYIREILVKYCGFMSVPIYFHDVTPKAADKFAADTTAADAAATSAEAAVAAATGESEEVSPEPVEKPINNTSPLWQKNPRDVTDEEYKQFYRDTFHDFREPLFWVHLNMDYPFHLQGILYFPRTENVYESLEGRIKIFYNQVFVADNVKEIIPEFLFLLKGTIDCPDLPLNVSRSFLQNDQYVNKLSGHIVRKVADKLNDLFKNNRTDYEGYWKDIAVFVKYGMMKDEKFYDRVKDSLIFETTEHEFKTLPDLGEKLAYTTDPERQVTYLQLAKERGQDVVIMNHELDNHFMSFIEYKNPGVKFSRVDAEVGGETADDDRKEALTDLFRKATGDDKLTVEVRSVGAEALPALLVESEESRRMQEMRKQFQQMNTGDSDEKVDFDSLFPIERKLVINDDQALAGRLLALSQVPGSEDRARELATQLFDLARLGHGSLAADDLAAFIKRSGALLQELVDKE